MPKYPVSLRASNLFAKAWLYAAFFVSVIVWGAAKMPPTYPVFLAVSLAGFYCLHRKLQPEFYRELIYFIEANHLFVEKPIHANDRSGYTYSRPEISRSVKIDTWRDESNLYIKVEKCGVKFDDKLDEYGAQLETLTGCRLFGVEKKRGYVLFTFKCYEKMRGVYSCGNIIEYDPNAKYLISVDIDRLWDFVKSPGAIVTGNTGSGKSYFIWYLILSFIKRGASILCIDPKRTDFIALKGTAHRYASETPEIFSLIKEADELLNSRAQHLAENDLFSFTESMQPLRPAVLVIDEYSALIASFTNAERRDFEAIFKRVILKGRAVGLFTIVGMQRPDASVLLGELRDQLSLKVALGNMSDDGYRMIFSNADVKRFESTGAQAGYYFISGSDMTAPERFETPLLEVDDFRYEARCCTEWSKANAY
jgi:hypothetical protein